MQNKCLGVFLVVLAIPFVSASILMLALRPLNSADFYKKILNQTNTYQKLAQNPALSQSPKENNFLGFLLYNANADWYQANIEKNLDALFGFLNKENSRLEVGIPTDLLKKNVAANSQFPPQLLSAVPDELTTTTYLQLVKEMSKIAGNAAGGEFEKGVQDATRLDQQFQQNSQVGQKFYSYSKLSGFLVYILTLLILLCIALAARCYPPAIFRWVGEALIIPSALVGLTFFLIQPFFADALNQTLTKLPTETQQIVNPLVSAAVQDILNRIQRVAMTVSMVGLIMLVISYILPKVMAKDIQA